MSSRDRDIRDLMHAFANVVQVVIDRQIDRAISPLKNDLDSAYNERNRLVAVLSRLYPSHLATPDDAEPGWAYIVCVHTPVGQATWHIPDRELPLFLHLSVAPNDWDGHSTQEKYRRLTAIESTDISR